MRYWRERVVVMDLEKLDLVRAGAVVGWAQRRAAARRKIKVATGLVM